MKDSIGDIRNKIICCQAVIKLVARGKKKECVALLEIAKELSEMDQLCRNILAK